MSEEPKPIKTERIDNPDGTYTVKEFYKNCLTLALHDNNCKLLSCKWFKDYECKELLGKSWRKYNKDNSYTEYFTYQKWVTTNEVLSKTRKPYLSRIIQINSNSQIIMDKTYNDKNFKKIDGIAKFEYKQDGSHIVYTVYKTPQESIKYLSTIGVHNIDNTKIIGKLFSDNKFKDIIAEEKREFNDNFTECYCELVYSKPYQNIYYSSKRFIRQNGVEQTLFYKDKNFTNLAKEYDYSEDGSYIIKQIYDEPNGKNCLSTINYFNDKQWIKGVGYSDNNFEKLAVTINVDLEKNTITTIYEKPFGEDNILATVEYNNEENIKVEKHYKDRELQILCLT